MTTFARHGGGSHFVRPDFTYITSVRQPIGGYDPRQDVMAVTGEFTLGPQSFQQGAGLSGPPITFLGPSGRPPVSFFGPSSWWQRTKMRFQMWKARRAGLGFAPYGPPAWAGGRAVPMIANREAMLVAMGAQNIPPQFSAIDAGLIPMRYR